MFFKSVALSFHMEVGGELASSIYVSSMLGILTPSPSLPDLDLPQ